jgi:hypothetical protein
MDIADFSERGYEVIVIDPMFSASVGERADKRPKLPAIAPPKKGIDKGCAIVRGFYLPPPYEVTVEEQDGIIQACINGVPIYRAEPARLLAAARPPVALPADGQFTLSQRTDLKRYVSRIFKDVKLAKGAKAAAKAVEEFLRTQKSAVKNYEFGTDYDSLEIEWADGNADEILLYSVEAPLSATTKPDGPLLKLVLAEAEDIRKQAEKTLAAGGLILAPSRWSPKFFIGEEAKAKLQVILDGMSEIYRWRDIIQVGVFGGASERRWEAGWEVVLNLRYRELALHRK